MGIIQYFYNDLEGSTTYFNNLKLIKIKIPKYYELVVVVSSGEGSLRTAGTNKWMPYTIISQQQFKNVNRCKIFAHIHHWFRFFLSLCLLRVTAENTTISYNFLVWKFCEKGTVSAYCWVIFGRNYAKTVPFHKLYIPGN